jgi:protein associated with RNAse G/E
MFHESEWQNIFGLFATFGASDYCAYDAAFLCAARAVACDGDMMTIPLKRVATGSVETVLV